MTDPALNLPRRNADTEPLMAYVSTSGFPLPLRSAARAFARAALATVICVACGSEPAPPDAASEAAKPADNQPPRLGQILLEPQNPTRADVLSLMVEVTDPERDAIQFQVDWFKNGILILSGSELKLPAASLHQGDEIFARVTASDQSSEVTGESSRVHIGNSPPRVTALSLLPAQPTGADNLMATVESLDSEGDEVGYRFEWWSGSQQIPGAKDATLDASQIRRGDEIYVRVTPTDGTSEGEPLRSASVRVQNAPPKITSEPNYDAAGPDLYEYQVTAEDPDGDQPMRFDLVEGPEGMQIDIVSGHLSWRVPEAAAGNYTIEISVQDPHGGESRQRYVIDLQWAAPEAPAQPQPPAADAP
jgi:hypothetical protein